MEQVKEKSNIFSTKKLFQIAHTITQVNVHTHTHIFTHTRFSNILLLTVLWHFRLNTYRASNSLCHQVNLSFKKSPNDGKIGLPWWLSGKESACNAGDAGSIPGLGRSSGEGIGCPLQYSFLGNLRDRGAWWVAVRGVPKSRTRLSSWAHTAQKREGNPGRKGFMYIWLVHMLTVETNTAL